MDILKFIGELAKKERYSLRSLNDSLNTIRDKEVLNESFYRKLKTRAIKYTEMEQIADLLGYDIVWKKRE